jgi:hypothetical protein
VDKALHVFNGTWYTIKRCIGTKKTVQHYYYNTIGVRLGKQNSGMLDRDRVCDTTAMA